MNARLAAIALGALLAVPVLAGTAMASASSAAPTHLSISAPTTTVSGGPVAVHVLLTDQEGKPVPGALIRLVSTVTFMGSDHEEIMDEAQTDAAGKAVLTFAPADSGPATVTARFAGSQGLAPSDAALSFDVQQPVVAYHPTPVGIQAPWARSYFILVPFLGIWFTYLVVLRQARKVRRAGVPSPSPQGSAG